MINFSNATKENVSKLYNEGNSCSKIAKTFLCSESFIVKFMNKNAIPFRHIETRNRKHSLKEDYFEKIDTVNKAYILGFLYADGYVNLKRKSLKIALVEKDLYILEQIKKEFNSSSKIKISIQKEKKYCIFTVAGKTFIEHLINVGCTQAKTFTLTFPSLDQVPQYLQSHFIRGYFDGDGCNYQGKKKTIIKNKEYIYDAQVLSFCGRKEFLQEIALIISKALNIFLKTPYKHKTISCLSYSSKKDYNKILDYLVKDSDIKLERKYKRMNKEEPNA